MKRFLILSLVLGVGVAVGRMLDGVPRTAAAGARGQGGGAENCAAQNGDVNADGNIDLSDAVTILGNLFLGSPTELVPLCEKPPVLPATGQTVCYGLAKNGRWVPVPCADATYPGQDGSYATGCPSEGRFIDNGDGTVTDHCTGLMWQKDTADVNGDGQVHDDRSDGLDWSDALAYCENLSFAGHDDWRLPNVRELQSIVDYGLHDPSIDPVFGALLFFYWSSTSFAAIPDTAWSVVFNAGEPNGDPKHDVYYVRAVRRGP